MLMDLKIEFMYFDEREYQFCTIQSSIQLRYLDHSMTNGPLFKAKSFKVYIVSL